MNVFQLKQILKDLYETAWFLCRRIGEAVKVDLGEELLTGINPTKYIAWPAKFMHKSRKTNEA